MATFSSIDRRHQRWIATSESLPVFPVALIFMTLFMSVLNFWQGQQIDRRQMLANAIAHFNIPLSLIKLFTKGANIIPGDCAH